SASNRYILAQSTFPLVDFSETGNDINKWKLKQLKSAKPNGLREKAVFTTFETAKLCQVSPLSIINWVNAGRLSAFRTPGGHRRIRREDLIRFMRDNGIPLPEDLRECSGRPRVLVVDDESAIRETLAEFLTMRARPYE